MKLSIIIAVYNSHEAVKRQLAYLNAMNLPDDIEVILVDDGSHPPIIGTCKNLHIYYTNDKRPWTQGLARNDGAMFSTGERILMTDIDHILSKEAIMAARDATCERMIFPRYFGVLLPGGYFTQDLDTLRAYGLDMKRVETKRGLYASVHGNTFAMPKSTFIELGMYDERHCTYGHHASSKRGEDSEFNHRWNRYAAKKGVFLAVGPKIYIFPVGRYHVSGDLNPMNLFHDLSQQEIVQPMKP